MSFHSRPLGFETLESRRVLSSVTNPLLANTVFVNIPDNLTGQPGQQVAAPVHIDNAAGVRGVEIRIDYDTQFLDVDTSGVALGSVWTAADARVVANVDDASGSIVAWVFASEGPSSGGGSLLTVQFAIHDDAPIGGSTRIDLARVRLNEGEIAADPEPIPGSDSTDGRITFVSAEQTSRVSGTVYADTNENNQPDSFEGVPRVRIVLTNIDSGQQRETFTDDEGRYEFRDLTAGSYRITEQQPAAFLDGGSNELSVQVAAGQELSGQNFRERGLRPEYVYNRLFTTPVMPVGSTDWVTSVRRIVDDAGETTTQTPGLAVQSSATPTATTPSAASPATQPANNAATPPLTVLAAAQPSPDSLLAPTAQPAPATQSSPVAQPPVAVLAKATFADGKEASEGSRQPEEEIHPHAERGENGPVATAAIALVNIPDNLTGQPGQQVIAPVNIDNPAGLRGVEIRISYDTQLLDADAADVLLGSVWEGADAQVVANVDDETGSITAWVYASEGLGANGGSLAEIRFAISGSAAAGGSTPIDLAQVRMNEGDIVAQPEPIPGADSTDGLITFVGVADTAVLSGTVYADTNENNQPDAFEGVPRVQIVLTDTASGHERVTFTDDAGDYEFRDLAAGSYRVEQQQPAAFLDGGANELSVQLVAGQTLSDQDFRERGLRPEYVYNRLFSTTALPVGSAPWISTVRRIVDDAELAALDLAFDASANWLD